MPEFQHPSTRQNFVPKRLFTKSFAKDKNKSVNQHLQSSVRFRSFNQNLGAFADLAAIHRSGKQTAKFPNALSSASQTLESLNWLSFRSWNLPVEFDSKSWIKMRIEFNYPWKFFRPSSFYIWRIFRFPMKNFSTKYLRPFYRLRPYFPPLSIVLPMMKIHAFEKKRVKTSMT